MMYPIVFTWFLSSGCSGEKPSNDNTTDTSPSVEDDPSLQNMGINPRIHRLTHLQWNNSVASLLNIDASSFSDNFQQSTLSAGFENNGEVLAVDTILFQDYQRAAESLGAQVVSDLNTYAYVVSEDPREGGSTIAYTERIEGESEDAIGTTGAASGNRYNLWSNGTLSVEFDIPHAGLYTLRTLVSGTPCDDDLGAAMELRLDGEALVATEVLDPIEVSVESNISTGTHIVSIAFSNDCYEPDLGFDRNLLIDWIEVEGGVDLGTSTQSLTEVTPWVERFVSEAFRRPLTSDEVALWNEVFVDGATLLASGDDIADGVRLVVTAVLQSPDFLYRIERTEPNTILDPFELASKLSFQVCNTPPDSDMVSDLDNGNFIDNYTEHAERLLLSECGQENLLQLHKELFHWDGYANIDQPDDNWDTELNTLFKEEIEQFIAWHIYTENGTVKELYTADYTIANDRLAALYGVESTTSEFTRIDLDPTERSGILTLLGPLAYKSDVGQSSPIHRGVFINDIVLCKSLPAPPDVVPGLPVQDPTLTNRERVEAHTGEGTCGEGCHSALINPPGFAFEQYDELGRFRTEDNGLPVDAGDDYYFILDGLQSWQTGVEFTQILAESQEAHQCYAEHVLSYFLGRPIQDDDEHFVETLYQASKDNTSILDLVLLTVELDSFRYRGAE